MTRYADVMKRQSEIPVAT